VVQQLKYVEIADVLAKRITQGTYPLGKRLPAVRALVDEFEVSDETIRNALSRLAEMGLVQGRERVGTIVIATEPREPAEPSPPRSLAERVAELERWRAEHERHHDG
jgi:DNA-binding GntR family transcriptional regulator